MAQVVANLFQRQTLLQEVGRAGMTEGVGAVVREGGAHRTQAPRDDQVEGPAVHRAKGSVTGDEQLAQRCWRPCLAQVADQRGTDGSAEWVDLGSSGLGVPHGEPFLLPVQIVQAKSHHLPRTKAVDSQKEEQSVIPDVHGLIPCSQREHLLDFVPGRAEGERSLGEHARGFESRRQTWAAPLAPLRKAKEGTQLADDLLGGSAGIATSGDIVGERLIELRHRDHAEGVASHRDEPVQAPAT